jgi:hypothetical protein
MLAGSSPVITSPRNSWTTLLMAAAAALNAFAVGLSEPPPRSGILPGSQYRIRYSLR